MASAGYTAASSKPVCLRFKSFWKDQKAFSKGLTQNFLQRLFSLFPVFSTALEPFRFSYKNLCGHTFFRKIYRSGAP
jgi:hypothetical protein